MPILNCWSRFSRDESAQSVFEVDYLALFKADQRRFPDEVFEILNKLFSDVDMFVSDPEIRGAGGFGPGTWVTN